jgi:hypothetical protein
MMPDPGKLMNIGIILSNNDKNLLQFDDDGDIVISTRLEQGA